MRVCTSKQFKMSWIFTVLFLSSAKNEEKKKKEEERKKKEDEKQKIEDEKVLI